MVSHGRREEPRVRTLHRWLYATALAYSCRSTCHMKILIIHQYYLMPGQPGGSRFNEMARFWAEQGHEVTVIAGTVDYASGKSPGRYRGRWIVKEDDGSVLVYRCHVPTTYASSYRGRMWAFLGFT